MEYVPGQTLATLVRERPLEARRAADLLFTVARAIDHAHQKGILHRDLKPSNVLLDEGGEPRITDFGLAKRLRDASELTAGGQLLGSPHYLPPEQISHRAGAVGPQSD